MFYQDQRSSDRQTWRRRVAAAMAGAPDAPNSAGRLHVPLPRQIARTSASLLFSDGFSFQYREARVRDIEGQAPAPEVIAARAAETELQTYADTDGWQSKLWQAAYVSSGTGGIYLLPAWYQGDASTTLRIVHHNRGVPTFIGGRLVEAILWTVVEVEASGVTWRHLECYTRGRVQHGLYRGQANNLGERVSLGDHRATAGLVTEPDGYVDLTAYGLRPDELLCEYVPNLLPHPVTLDGNIGGADTQGFEDQLYALDTADSGWEADVRVGKRRILVTEDMLSRTGRGGGASFDTDREVFVSLSHSPLESHDPIRPIDFAIRAADFQTTVKDRYARCCTAAGYNPESVTWAQTDGSMTATEVLSRDALSRDTTNSKRRYFTPALEATASKALRISATLGGVTATDLAPKLVWPQTDDGDQASNADLINTLALAGAISIYRKVQIANPTWDDEQVREEVARIREDNGQSVPDPEADLESRDPTDPEV